MATTAPLAGPTRRVLVPQRLGDERLAERVARGDAAAFSALYERYHQPLFRLCLAILRHEADAQDALQSTFERALSALERGRRDAPVRPWLYRIAHNEAITIHRRRRPVESLENVFEGAVPSAEEVAARRASLATLLADLADLPERARGALVLRELSGLSHEDIATVLEISPSAAKQAIFEARRALAELSEGRAMSCAEVQRVISDGDRRALRGRRLRAHLRDCGGCRAFRAAIPARTAELRALTPALPPAAAAAILARTLGSGAASIPASLGGAVGTGLAGKALLGVGAKLATLAAVLGTAGGVVVVSDVLPHRPAPAHRAAPIHRAAPAHPGPGAPARAAGPGHLKARAAAPGGLAGTARVITPARASRSASRSPLATAPVRAHGRGALTPSAGRWQRSPVASVHARASAGTSTSTSPGRHRALGHANAAPADRGHGQALGKQQGGARSATSPAAQSKHSPHSS